MAHAAVHAAVDTAPPGFVVRSIVRSARPAEVGATGPVIRSTATIVRSAVPVVRPAIPIIRATISVICPTVSEIGAAVPTVVCPAIPIVAFERLVERREDAILEH